MLFDQRQLQVKRVTVQLDDDLHKQLKILSAQSETSMNDLFLDALKQYLEDAKDQEEL